MNGLIYINLNAIFPVININNVNTATTTIGAIILIIFFNFMKFLNDNAANAIIINGSSNVNKEFIKKNNALNPSSYLIERYIFSKQSGKPPIAKTTLGIKSAIAIIAKT